VNGKSCGLIDKEKAVSLVQDHFRGQGEAGGGHGAGSRAGASGSHGIGAVGIGSCRGHGDHRAGNNPVRRFSGFAVKQNEAFP
jgi:hypothetical protein